MDEATGLIAVDAVIADETYPVAIDNGWAYTWFRQATAKGWVAMHPGWERGVGAVGASNMRMAGDGAEARGILLRLPEVRVGPLTLKEVGALGVGPDSDKLDIFDWYSKKNAVPVLGWFGGSVLKAFRLSIDYPNHTIYWLQQAGPDSHRVTVQAPVTAF